MISAVDEEDITIEYVDTKADPEVYVLSMSSLVDSIVKKVLPDALEIQQCHTYVLLYE